MDHVKLAIVGAGPHALGLASRVIHAGLPDFLSEREHSEACRACCKWDSLLSADQVAVFDPSGAWMSKWRSYFTRMDIAHLRSPVTHHPGPADSHELLEFAHNQGREDELFEFARLLRSATKTNRDYNLAVSYEFPAPSAALFSDYCRDLEQRLALDKLIVPQAVVGLRPVPSDDQSSPQIILSLADGTEVLADHVVLAIGEANSLRVPDWAAASFTAGEPGLWHVLQREAPQQSLKTAAVHRSLIVGGGLSAAHVAIACAKRGGAPPLLLVRGSRVEVSQFDASFRWTGRYSAKSRALFLGQPLEKRAELLRSERFQGTVSPEVYRELTRLEACGALEIRTASEVTALERSDSGAWSARIMHRSQGAETSEAFGEIILATGSERDIRAESLLRGLGDVMQVCDGLPVLRDDDLSLGEQCRSVHVLGAYASLALGPTAGNLGGMVLGAHQLFDWFDTLWRSEDHAAGVCDSNPFQLLADESEDSDGA